jgi:sec-independent protein translocase protein TatA
MFGIGGGEFLFIIVIVLMLFGSDKIPEMARALGKGMAQLKNATNDVKSEIQKGMKENGIDPNELTSGITNEIAKAKEGFTKMVNESHAETALKSELDQIRENFAKMNTDVNPEAKEFTPAAELPATTELPEGHEGPIKRS